VPLEDLGPALFNRQGAATCGQHCHDLGRRILTMEGFATFRYVAGFCHEPDPEDLQAVARHGNSMVARDPLLPRLPMRALKGVFAKTHLVTFLQLYKNGQMPALATAQANTAANTAEASNQSKGSETGTDEFTDVLEQGIFMHVFPWWVVRDHRDAVLALMASDNFDHGFGLADSELRCINAVRAAITACNQGRLAVPCGETQYDVVQRHVLRMAGQKWREQDIGSFWNFTVTTLDQHMEIMQDVWSFAGCESVLRVEAAFFGELAKVSSKFQWTRASLAIAHFLSDRDKECSVVAGRCVAGAISKTSLKKIRERDAASSQAWEEWSEAIMEKYWVPTLKDPALVPRATVLKAVAGFLCRNGKGLLGSLVGDVSAQQAKLESKLRQALEAEWTGPFPKPVTASCQEETKIENWRRELDTESVLQADASGRPVVTAKRAAAEKNLKVGMEVMAKRRKAGENTEDTTSVATITDISDEGVKVTWGGMGSENGTVDTIPITDIGKVPQKPSSASSQESKPDSLHFESIKWAPCSTFDNDDMLLSLTKATLYQAYVGRSCAHEDLHISRDSGELQVYAKRMMKAKTLLLLPFGSIDTPASKGLGVPLYVEVSSDQNKKPTSVMWRLRAKPIPKKCTGTGEKAVALNPFWLLSTRPMAPTALEAAPNQVASELTYETIAFEALPPSMVADVKSSKTKSHIVVKTTALVNMEAVPKGALLYVTSKPPAQ